MWCCSTEGAWHERLLLAEPLLKSAMLRYGIENYRVIATCRGRELEGVKLRHPFYAREVPVILGEHVTTDAGTGAVHTAPGHGQEDYVVGARYELAVDNPGGRRRQVSARHRTVCRRTRVQGQRACHRGAQAARRAGACEALHHSYPHCWRHKTPIIFRATSQWFISMERGCAQRR